MVARPARLDHHRARLLLLKERQQLVPPELALQLCLSGLVHPVHLKHGLCRIQTDHGNAHRGRSFRFVSNDPDFGTSMPGAVHPISTSAARSTRPLAEASISTATGQGVDSGSRRVGSSFKVSSMQRRGSNSKAESRSERSRRAAAYKAIAASTEA